MYKILRNILFLFDPEWVHYFSMNSLKLICRIGFLKKMISRCFSPKNCEPVSLLNISFSNRVGLGAGFDKNATYLNELEVLGFGFVEIGTATPLPQAGNDKPRLFRLPKDKALINRMGFNNDGVKIISERLLKWRENNLNRNQKSSLIIGGNIGKNKVTPNEDAWKDYEKCFMALHPLVDYFVVNVSSPNTPGLRELQEKEPLKKILTNLQRLNAQKETPKPILLKIAPDLSESQLDDVIELAMEIKLDGLVVTNTSIDRSNLTETSKKKAEKFGNGGLSGMPVKQRSTALVKYVHHKTNGKMPIIASGGIFNGKDVFEKLDAGASLIQVWTGFVYEGPGIVKSITTYIAGNQ